MQQPQVSFYSSATTTNTGEDNSQVIDAAMTSAVTSLIRSSNNIHSSLQQLATSTAPTPTPVPAAQTTTTNIGQTQQKRKQVKNACTNCQKACKKCDDARPCPRCIKYGIESSCVNSVRKERKKGIKRGPYKRRQKDDEGSNDNNNNNVSRPRKSVKKDSNNNEKRQGEQQERGTTGAAAAAAAAVAAATTTSPYEAMRPPNVPYGYPSNLNQYQPYDATAYGSYAAVYHQHKDHMMTNPYVSAVYHQMGYPVVLPGNNSDATTNHHHRNNNEEEKQDEDDEKKQEENGNDENNENNKNNHDDDDSKVSSKKKQEDCKQSNTSPVPSTSTSPATTSSPESNEDDDATKLQNLQRLTELCTAALSHNNEQQQSRTE
ncbi:hypothetical protein BDA99DRAFT_582213 [Phascolomyces articulosus]|uniref:Zn(2)-C6 fungal-type domain-containing protein n=1 Tax=Phascolomyces articulosus TaxID=60185 RepID=A0AAD5JYP5_9FUNG|nr:hypothetical protein BDA99DRAFT_582213 [Phascolomyces articulosus]